MPQDYLDGWVDGQTYLLSNQYPVPMLLFCPVCHKQHVDEVDPVNNPGWDNPPHTSHKCLGCGCIWRPSDVPTEGVRSIATRGKSDTWPREIDLPRPTNPPRPDTDREIA